VPRGLYRLHHSGSAHFITFTCYHRYAHLSDPFVRDLFVQALERSRKLYGMLVYGFVVMPEHVHLLLSEPERGTVANAVQSLKISSAKRSNSHISQTKGNVGHPVAFWQKRYYDRNVRGTEFREKLRYIHRNPVKRGLDVQLSHHMKAPHFPNEGKCGLLLVPCLTYLRHNCSVTGLTASLVAGPYP
jgi:putative transposase